MGHRFNLTLPALIAVAALIPATSLSSIPRPESPFAAEDTRLRSHFAHTLRELSQCEPAGLTARQRAARAGHLRALDSYAQAGRFPRHHGEIPGRTPIFVDREGNRCAMAFLIERSGGAALVARVARTDNLVCILDLAGDPELAAWLKDAGLSLEEAARIQPAYDHTQEPEDSDAPGDDVMGSSTFLAIGLCGPAIYMNMNDGYSRERRISNIVLGTVAGAAVAAAGVVDWSRDSHLRGTGYIALTMGLTSLVMSQVNLWRGSWPERIAEAGGIEPRAAPPGPAWNAGVRMNPEGEPQLAVRLGF